MKKKPWNSVISSVWQRTLVFSIIMATKKTKDWSRTSIGEHVYQLNVTVRHHDYSTGVTPCCSVRSA